MSKMKQTCYLWQRIVLFGNNIIVTDEFLAKKIKALLDRQDLQPRKTIQRVHIMIADVSKRIWKSVQDWWWKCTKYFMQVEAGEKCTK
jgi:N-glycosylase/DNA lyase